MSDDEYIFSGNTGAHVSMWDVNGVRFKGSVFHDVRTAINMQQDGRIGIYSVSSNYNVDEYCSTPFNCPGLPSEFKTLSSAIESYGGGSHGVTIISNSIFDSHKGAFLQCVNNAKITANDFTVPHDAAVVGSTDYPYGLYIDESQHFTIEGNQFTGITGSGNVSNGGGAGLLIRNTGPNNNDFYRNNFDNLKVGSQGLSENRSTGLDFGLTFKCNTYEETYDDFDILNDPNDPYKIFGQLGIAELQGITMGSTPDVPYNQFANNSAILNLNLDNKGNWINYLYTGTPVSSNFYYPDKVTSITNRFSTTLTDPCPNRLSMWGYEQATVLTEIGLFGPVMMLTVNTWGGVKDGGFNHQILINSIENATGGNITIVLTELLQYSPYLSNDVLAKIATMDNAVWTEQMIVDVLLANPHSSRSVWVQHNLDLRINPISMVYRDSLNTLINTYTHRDSLASENAYALAHYDRLLTELLHTFRSDSIVNVDDLSIWLKHPVNHNYHYELAELYFDHGDGVNYSLTLDSILFKFDLDSNELTFHSSFGLLFDQLDIWQNAGANLYEPDSTRKAWLLNYVSNNTRYPGKVYALLEVNGISLKDPNVFIPPPALSPLFSSLIDDIDEKSSQSPVILFPNPAKNIVSLEWRANSVRATIQVFDLNGNVIKTVNWEGEPSISIDISSWSAGIYVVQTQTSDGDIFANKLLINR